MFLTNALNLEYKHIEKGTNYTLLYVGNANCDQSILNDRGLPKWEPQATYRNNETGEVFTRPMAEFETKFVAVFPALEKRLAENFDLLKQMGLLNVPTSNRRLIALLGVAKELWSLFPLIKEEIRVDIICALNFTDYVNQIEESEAFFATHLNEQMKRLPKLFADAGATINVGEGATIQTGFDPAEDTNNVLGLLMVGLASSVREYKFLTAITVEETDVDAHVSKIEVLIEAIKASALWFDKVGVNVALPSLTVKYNSFDPAVLTETN